MGESSCQFSSADVFAAPGESRVAHGLFAESEASFEVNARVSTHFRAGSPYQTREVSIEVKLEGKYSFRRIMQRKHHPHNITCGKVPFLYLANRPGGRPCHSNEFFILHMGGYKSGNIFRRAPFEPAETKWVWSAYKIITESKEPGERKIALSCGCGKLLNAPP